MNANYNQNKSESKRNYRNRFWRPRNMTLQKTLHETRKLDGYKNTNYKRNKRCQFYKKAVFQAVINCVQKQASKNNIQKTHSLKFKKQI